MLGERLGGSPYSFADVVGSLLTLHVLLLQHMRDRAQLVVYEYSRNHASEQGRALAQASSTGHAAALPTPAYLGGHMQPMPLQRTRDDLANLLATTRQVCRPPYP